MILIPLLFGILAAQPPGPRTLPTATITGKVLYRSDQERPWRLGRYYIKDARTGELAEAVAALSRRGLKGPEPSPVPQTVTIDQKDFQFTPETVAIRAGDRVRFLNHDPQLHNVQTFHPRHSFNVNISTPGEHDETFAFASGIGRPYRITCAFHGAMRAWVFVFDHPWYQVTGKDGVFRLADVPPGEYSLELVHPAGELRAAQAIALKPGETLAVEFHLSPDDKLAAQP
jgi:plastocyanin